MADDAELLPEEEEVQGGAVKSFLEHLEDLRWTIVKCSAAIFVGMCVCLFGVNKMVAILKWPLDRASLLSIDTTNQMVTVKFGAIQLGTYEVSNNFIGSLYLGTNHNITIAIEPITVTAMGGSTTQRSNDSTIQPFNDSTIQRSNGSQLLSARLLPNQTSSVRKGPDLIFLDPSAPFLSSLHLAFFGGLFIASPFVFYYLGLFLMPALKIKEKKYFLRAFFIGLALFFLGVGVAYFGIMPRALKFAELYANWMGVKVPEWRAESYFSFLVKFMFGMGLGFELPVVLLALVKIGVLDYAKLTAMRRYMVVINLILGALLTTPEVFTQLVMGLALQILFEISVLVAWHWERKAKKHEDNK